MTAARLDEDRARPVSLVCAVCGYGIAKETPPGPCPMCHTDDAWIRSNR
jgi:rubrerythrin